MSYIINSRQADQTPVDELILGDIWGYELDSIGLNTYARMHEILQGVVQGADRGGPLNMIKLYEMHKKFNNFF